MPSARKAVNKGTSRAPAAPRPAPQPESPRLSRSARGEHLRACRVAIATRVRPRGLGELGAALGFRRPETRADLRVPGCSHPASPGPAGFGACEFVGGRAPVACALLCVQSHVKRRTRTAAAGSPVLRETPQRQGAECPPRLGRTGLSSRVLGPHCPGTVGHSLPPADWSDPSCGSVVDPEGIPAGPQAVPPVPDKCPSVGKAVSGGRPWPEAQEVLNTRGGSITNRSPTGRVRRGM